MPATAPYDTVEAVLQAARVRLNDAIISIQGDILTDTAAFSQSMMNAAWHRLQELLANQGFAALNRETILASVPACLSSDQGVRVWFNWVNYFNGSGNVSAPVLPQDLIAPLDLAERAAGGTANFMPMDQCFNGLPTAPRGALNRLWEWRQETIYLPGATAATDILMRYAGFLADFVDNSPLLATPWYGQAVPIMRSLNSLAWFICSEMARARVDLDAGYFDQQAQQAAEYVWNRDYRQGRSLYARAELGKMPDPHSATAGPAGPRGPQKGNS